MPPRRDYRISRQRHLGEMLDELQSLGAVNWKWKYDNVRSRATYLIAVGDDERQLFETRAAEDLVVLLCDQLGIIWEPVPHPGGKEQLEATLASIDDRKRDSGT